jgi:hypothetical protein
VTVTALAVAAHELAALLGWQSPVPEVISAARSSALFSSCTRTFSF